MCVSREINFPNFYFVEEVGNIEHGNLNTKSDIWVWKKVIISELHVYLSHHAVLSMI